MSTGGTSAQFGRLTVVMNVWTMSDEWLKGGIVGCSELEEVTEQSCERLNGRMKLFSKKDLCLIDPIH